ncbi:MAG TPA: hypothetical protein VFF44_06120 [Casimicrobiaceae bacterium]|nr:hypothetical protein [Casimicrobiaceae bacterium]
MKPTTAAAIIAASAFLVTAASAQAPSPAPAAPAAAAASTPAKAPPRPKSGSGAPADARVCLEFSNNMQVIQCAEKYRHMKAPT